MCQYLCEIQTVGTHDNLIRSGNLTQSINFCSTGDRLEFRFSLVNQTCIKFELAKLSFSPLMMLSILKMWIIQGFELLLVLEDCSFILQILKSSAMS